MADPQGKRPVVQRGKRAGERGPWMVRGAVRSLRQPGSGTRDHDPSLSLQEESFKGAAALFV